MSLTRLFRTLLNGARPDSIRHVPESDFFVGANLPWIVYGCDFGANAWQPDGGMSRVARQDALRRTLAALARTGIRTVRWFLLCDGRAGLDFRRNGVLLDPVFFRDMDCGLKIAEETGITVMFTLFDFHWFLPAKFHRGVQAGGRADYFRDNRLRKSLMNHVVHPILARYGQHRAIHSWDVFNEPEWILRRGLKNLRTGISLRSFRKFVGESVHLIHQETIHPSTLGLARRSSLELFDNLPLDFLQAHWYDRQGEELREPIRSRIPVVLGEFPTSGSSLPVAEILRRASEAGFAGALGWSAHDGAGLSSMSALASGMDEFLRAA